MSLSDDILEAFNEYLEKKIMDPDYEHPAYIDTVRCKMCGNVGADCIDKKLDGGGPGNFWISTLRCRQCGHTADDAYHDGSEWRTD